MFLYAILSSEYYRGRTTEQIVTALIQGGINIIQLREKTATTREIINKALEIKSLIVNRQSKIRSIPLIINDRLDIALAIDSQGVHLGQQDIPINYARKILGKDRIIGISVNSCEEAKKAEKGSANYVAVSSPFSSETKKKTLIPLSEIKKIKNSVNIPVFAIGGINLDNLETILSTEVDGVCISKALLDTEDIKKTTQQFKERLKIKYQVSKLHTKM